MKKLTIEFIRSEFEKEEWMLISKEYVNSYSKLNYICSKGHSGSIIWSAWKSGKRCPTCAGNKKLTIGFIKKEFEKEEWKLVSTEYINANRKLDYICSEGHCGSIRWGTWQQGKRCPYCANNIKLDIKFIKKEFEKKGWRCVSTEYINAHQKLDYICPNGHQGSIKWNNWQQGQGCPSCIIKELSLRYYGSGNPAWKGGISCEPYCDVWKDKEYEEFIKQRDGYKCLNPYCNSKNPNDLTRHHIEYNKRSCSPKDIITICRSCNTKANTDRDWHEAWYKAIMYRRYGYIYD